jgi:hypothetical protein
MKKVILLFTIALLSAQIVNASPVDAPKGYGFLKPNLRGKLEPVEFKEAMLTLFAKVPNEEKIDDYFRKINGCSFSDMKEIYRERVQEAFGVENVTDAEMRKIFSTMKFRIPDEDYWETHESMYIPKGANTFDEMEWSSPDEVRENEQIGSSSLDGVTVDLVTTFCANCVKDKPKPVARKKKKVVVEEEEVETEYVRYPGSKKVITHEPDTVFISRSKVQIEENNTKKLVFNNNHSYEVDMNNAQYASNNQSQGCNHRQNTSTCNHRQENTCENDDNKCRQKKHKCNRGLWAAGGVVVGALGALIIENNLPGRSVRLPRRGVEQPPLDIIPTGGGVEQPPLQIFN